MADKKPTDEQQTDQAREEVGVATMADNASLEHTRGGVTTRDGMDAGVPMIAGDPNEPVGPEDAFGPGPKRGDYSDRVVSGPAMTTVRLTDDERRAEAERLAGAAAIGDHDIDPPTADQYLADVPTMRLVPAATAAGEVGEAPGKGGVSTEEARAGTAATTGGVTAV